MTPNTPSLFSPLLERTYDAAEEAARYKT